MPTSSKKPLRALGSLCYAFLNQNDELLNSYIAAAAGNFVLAAAATATKMQMGSFFIASEGLVSR